MNFGSKFDTVMTNFVGQTLPLFFFFLENPGKTFLHLSTCNPLKCCCKLRVGGALEMQDSLVSIFM